ncbi:MAG: pyridoxal-phosphate dependent enzyme, partial [Alphaproteobacteria bacterium]|nr:pyridoxal-phosphate dependent enzyme [Alphaproteobacteria bacterium]
MQKRANYFTHLECSETGERYEPDQPHNLSKAGKPLLARYDLEKMKAENDRGAIWARGGGFWKWRELLPVANDVDVCALGEVDTPLIDVPATGKASGATGKVWVKDEGRLPTGSFKARGLALAVAMAKELGVKRMAMPTNG